jgi:glutaredoxin
MKNLQELKKLVSEKNVIFYKPECPFCAASQKLLEKLQSLGLIIEFSVLYLDSDFDNQVLKELVLSYGWELNQEYPSKPQIFINERGKTEYIPGNDFLYKSDWNLGENSEGEIELKGQKFKAPQLKNPME